MSIRINNAMHIPLDILNDDVIEEIKARFTFKNPKYDQARARMKAMGHHGRPQVPEVIRGYWNRQHDLVVPRGCVSEVLDLINRAYNNQVALTILNQTRKLPPVEFEFRGQLKPVQVPIADAILGRRFGTIQSPPGSGKTVISLYVIAKRQQPALVIVHTTRLLEQWIHRAGEFLGIPGDEIGVIGQGKRIIGRRLTIALVQTLRKCAMMVSDHIGHLVVDECHHVPSTTFTEAVYPFDAAYALGLSATHERSDGLTPLIYWYVGPLVYDVSQSALIRAGVIVGVEPIIRETTFEPTTGVTMALEEMTDRMAATYRGEANQLEKPTKERQRELAIARGSLIGELILDQDRNMMIVSDIAREVLLGPCIVLTARKLHAEVIAKLLKEMNIAAEFCHGDVPNSLQDEIIAALSADKIRVLVATGELLGEGFDSPDLAALFLATPIKFSGRLKQYLGRVARSADGKTKAKVYDYWDVNVPVLMSAARERMRTYNKLAREAAKKGPTPRKIQKCSE